MRKLVLWAGLVSVANVSNLAQQVPQSKYQNDPRLARLMAFFSDTNSPVQYLAADFLLAADRHHLDWRLLPSICVVESGGGKNFSKNNVFGWDSARRGFTSVRDGIYWVASRLAHSKLYKGKDLDGILTTYNPGPGYAARVKEFMRRVSPREPLTARAGVALQPSLATGLQSIDRPEPAQ